jgi:putative redox protein
MKTTTVWKSGRVFDSSFNDQFKIEMGDGNFSPKALLLSGLAGCAGIDVVLILEKMRVPFADLKIEVETEQTDGEPKVFKDIEMTFTVKAAEEARDKIKKAIDLSLEKYCGVAAMLQKHSKIGYNLQLQPE